MMLFTKTRTQSRAAVRLSLRCPVVVSLCAGLVVCAAGGTTAYATDYTWNGSNGDRFSQPLNWTPAGVPNDNTDNAIFVDDPSSEYSVSFISSMTNRSLEGRAGTISLWDSDGFSTYTLDAGGIFATAVIGSTAGPLTQLKLRGLLGASTSSIAANGPLFVALPAGSNARLEIRDFSWDNASWVQIGCRRRRRTGTQIPRLTLKHRRMLGNDVAATGTATVGGSGSLWTNTDVLRIGNFGTGTLTINALGAVSNDGDGSIAHFGGSIGIVLVTGGGALWQNNASLFVGGDATQAGGTATLTVEPGGTVTIVDNLRLYAGSSLHLSGGTVNAGSLSGDSTALDWTAGELNVTGVSVFVDPGEVLGDDRQIGDGQTLSVSGLPGVLDVGVNVGATLTVIGGGTVTSGSGLIGSVNGGSVLSTARITGSGSTWTMSGDLGCAASTEPT